MVLEKWQVGLDAAAEVDSAIVPSYLGPDHVDPERRDALAYEDWASLAAGGVTYLNAPYLPIALLRGFLQRAVATAAAGTTVVALLPASTGAAWWWDFIIEPGATVEFLRGRLAFEGPHARPGGTAPWSSAIVEWPGAA
jgi:hypothetical protein